MIGTSNAKRKSYIRINDDGSMTYTETYTKNGLTITYKETVWDDDDDTPDFEVRKVKKSDPFENIMKRELDLDNGLDTFKGIMENKKKEDKDPYKTYSEVFDKYSVDDLKLLKDNLDDIMSDDKNMVKIIDFMMGFIKNDN